MSRIGKQPVTLPRNTTITELVSHIEVKGPKGILQVPLFAGLQIQSDSESVSVKAAEGESTKFQGLFRTLLQNAVTGVNEGWTKDLELHGVGMRAAVAGSGITLNLGFSHPVVVEAPEGITFQVVKNVITVSGIDKQLVGEVSAKIRKLRKPEPYKGKGIRYSTEYVRRKAGKTGKAK